MWEIIDSKSMLSGLKRGQEIALRRDGEYIKFYISSIQSDGTDYVMLRRADGASGIKFLPIEKLLDGNWFLQPS